MLELRFKGSVAVSESEDSLFDAEEVPFADAPTTALLSALAKYASSYMSMWSIPEESQIGNIYLLDANQNNLAVLYIPSNITTWQFGTGMTYFWFRATASVTRAGNLTSLVVYPFSDTAPPVFVHTFASPIPLTTDMVVALSMTVQASFPSYTHISGPPIQAFNPNLDMYGVVLAYLFPGAFVSGRYINYLGLYGAVSRTVTLSASYSGNTAIYFGTRSFTSTFVFSTFVVNDHPEMGICPQFWVTLGFANTQMIFTPLATVVLQQPVTLDPEVNHRFTFMVQFVQG